MGQIHNRIAPLYHDPDSEESHHALSVLCTRLMFLMFCEDAGLIEPGLLQRYVAASDAAHLRRALLDLFAWLDTDDEARADEYPDELMARFPYMDGGLFRERVPVPQLDETVRHEILVSGCQEFDWSGVDPTVFGSIFEGALSHDTRRAGGMHYTSPENIHKVIDPLFLDDLKAELDEILEKQNPSARTRALKAYHEKIGSLTFLDPACGSGNFLTETYVCLRRLENLLLMELQKDGQTSLAFEDVAESPVKVTLANFHGIEINDFACCVARTALWIAEKQADINTAKVVQRVYEELPLREYDTVRKGNALRMDWNDVVPAERCDYVLGNPPFIGARNQTKDQKTEVMEVFHGSKNCGNVDYVAGWYMRAAEYIGNRPIRCAFVSTNSVCQGEQVASIWKPIYELGVRIDFAHDTFRWNSEATDEAHVFCVIVGFSKLGGTKTLFHHESPDADASVRHPENLNAYLADAPDVFIWNRSKPICDVPKIGIGSQPIDGGNYLFSDEERDEFLRMEPAAEKYFHRWLGSQEFINGKARWVLWLGNVSPSDFKVMPRSRERIERVREFRLSSSRKQTLKAAETPNHFGTEIIAGATSILIPKVSSERRRYIPMGFIDPETFCSDLVFLVPNAELYHYGVLQSQFHNAWMRVVCGRLKSDYRYSGGIVYNNFVWPEPSDAQRAEVERCAQAVLDARKLYEGSTLADMYDPDNDFLYPELKKAHKTLDAAVEAAYGVDFGGDEERIVAHLFKLYAERVCEPA